MAVPPVQGLDESCAWLRKAALTPFPPVTKFEQDHGHGRNKARTRAKLLLSFGGEEGVRASVSPFVPRLGVLLLGYHASGASKATLQESEQGS